MRWKSIALAGAAWPAAAGCNIYYNAARNLVNEPHVVCTQLAITHELRKEARATWQEVRAQYPRRAFAAEFRDGFLDGYVDYLDRGGNGSPRAVPPAHYTRQKKYFTAEGQCLLKQYLLGFQYGQEVAIATGRRQFLTVPVLLPEKVEGPPAFKVEPPIPTAAWPAGVHPSLVPPEGVPRGSGSDTPPPKPPPVVPPGGAGAPLPDVPPPVPPGPVPAGPRVKLPPPPADVPDFPAHVPTPSVLDDLPVVAPAHETPPPVAPTHETPPPVAPTHPD